jgi:hypothetical protein
MKRVVASSQEQCVAKNSMQETKNGVRGGGGGGENLAWEEVQWHERRKSVLPSFSVFLVESRHTYANLAGPISRL